MNAPDDNTALKGLHGWWGTPPRSGVRRIIAPWEYRHLRAWAAGRIGAGIVVAGLSGVTLAFGGDDRKTYGWTMAFLGMGVAQLSFAWWELSIARSECART